MAEKRTNSEEPASDEEGIDKIEDEEDDTNLIPKERRKQGSAPQRRVYVNEQYDKKQRKEIYQRWPINHTQSAQNAKEAAGKTTDRPGPSTAAGNQYQQRCKIKRSAQNGDNELKKEEEESSDTDSEDVPAPKKIKEEEE